MEYENSYYATDPYMSDTDLQILLGFFVFYLVFIGVLVAFNIIINWKLFTKAGRPGWYACIPFFDQFTMFKMTWGSWVPYILFMLVPIVNIVIACIHPFKMAKAFGKDTIYGVLTLFVPLVGLAILAFGDAQYVGPNGEPEYNEYNNYNNQDPRYYNNQDSGYQNNYNQNNQNNYY